MPWKIALHNLGLHLILDPVMSHTGTCKRCGAWFHKKKHSAIYCSRPCKDNRCRS